MTDPVAALHRLTGRPRLTLALGAANVAVYLAMVVAGVSPFDPSGAWKLILANELQSAGYEIQMAGLLCRACYATGKMPLRSVRDENSTSGSSPLARIMREA